MKASPRQQRLLLDLQHNDTTIAQLRRKRATLPQRAELAGLSGAAQTAKERYMEAQRVLDAQNAEIERMESDIRLVRERRTRDESLLAVSTSSKEAVALQSELDSLTRRTAELEDRELEMLEIQEAAGEEFAAAERGLAEVDGIRAGILADIAAAEQQLDRELSSHADERAGIAAELQRDVLDLYEDLRARTGLGAARLRGNVSEASNMALAPAELSAIRAAAPDELVFCPGTGTILVREEE